MISLSLTRFCSYPETPCGKAFLHTCELAIAVSLAVVGVLAILSKLSLPLLSAYCLTGIGGIWLLGNGISYSIMMCRSAETEWIVQEEPAPVQQPEIPKKLEEKPPEDKQVKPPEVKPKIDWQSQSRAHLSKAKEQIQAWKPEVGDRYLYTMTLADRQAEMQAELIADFEYVQNDSELPEEEKAELLNRMLEALPYRIGTQIDEVSSYPLVGIPNYHANNCYLNVGLQTLAHSHYGDYDLWCPTRKPEKPPEPQPLPAKPAPVIRPNFDAESDIEKLKLLSRQYDDDKVRYADEEKRYDDCNKA